MISSICIIRIFLRNGCQTGLGCCKDDTTWRDDTIKIGGNYANDDKKESIYQNIAAAFKLVPVVYFNLFITGLVNILQKFIIILFLSCWNICLVPVQCFLDVNNLILLLRFPRCSCFCVTFFIRTTWSRS